MFMFFYLLQNLRPKIIKYAMTVAGKDIQLQLEKNKYVLTSLFYSLSTKKMLFMVKKIPFPQFNDTVFFIILFCTQKHYMSL